MYTLKVLNSVRLKAEILSIPPEHLPPIYCTVRACTVVDFRAVSTLRPYRMRCYRKIKYEPRGIFGDRFVLFRRQKEQYIGEMDSERYNSSSIRKEFARKEK